MLYSLSPLLGMHWKYKTNKCEIVKRQKKLNTNKKELNATTERQQENGNEWAFWNEKKAANTEIEKLSSIKLWNFGRAGNVFSCKKNYEYYTIYEMYYTSWLTGVRKTRHTV